MPAPPPESEPAIDSARGVCVREVKASQHDLAAARSCTNALPACPAAPSVEPCRAPRAATGPWPCPPADRRSTAPRSVFLQAANRCAARARALAASTSRSFGGAEVTSASSSSARSRRHRVDRTLERLGVGLRGLREAADLAHVLERGRTHLFIARGRLEVVQHSDVPAHVGSYRSERRGACA